MIPINKRLPKEGERTKCQVNFWRHGRIHHTETMMAEYIGMNDIIGKPMWDIETYDEAYTEVTYWEPLA